MCKRISALAVAALVGCAASAHGAVMVSPGGSSAPWLGFMNVFDLSNNFIFASGWGVPDLRVTFDDPGQTLTLLPNSIGDPNEFWYTPSGGPGAAGNKLMEANMYQEVSDGSLSGQSVNFVGQVLSQTFTSSHVAKVFIRDFAPDYSSFAEASAPLTGGSFNLSLDTLPGAGRHVQYGFQVKGVCVWITDIAPFGSAVISTGAIPAPTGLAVLGLGGLIAGRRRRA